ncbi:hypothetical protein GTO10_04410 [Candidatus Saccharibacteria bacterium]|nr:hypothetical protein [Candidatus Saccharibacteria bacterium]
MPILHLKYSYLFGVLLSLIPWGLLFFHRRDLRREMLVMSMLVVMAGITAEAIWYTADWVKPETISGTPVGIEDIILSWGAGGVGAVLYEEFFKHRTYKRLRKKTNHLLDFLIPVLIFWIVTSVAFWALKLHSFTANMLGFASATIYIYLRRPDLIPNSLATGILGVIFWVPCYLLVFTLFPGFSEGYWQWGKLSGITLLGIPIEDYIWWIGAGAVIGPFYEFWQGLRIVEE